MPTADLLRVADSHHHLWDLGGPIRYPWLQAPSEGAGFTGDTSPIQRDYLISDYIADSESSRVVRSVHVQAECDPRDAVVETRWAQAVADEYCFPHGIVAFVALDQDDAASVLEAHCQYPNMRGVRQLLNWDTRPGRSQTERGDYMTDPAWRRGFALLGPLSLSFDLHIYPWQMRDAAELARAFPGTSLILDHTGLPADRDQAGRETWRLGMRTLAACPNVTVKISGLGMFDHGWTPESVRPFIDETIEIFGVERCMFGSNFPVDRLYSDYATLVSSFRDAISSYTADEQSSLLYDNAVRIYRLSPG